MMREFLKNGLPHVLGKDLKDYHQKTNDYAFWSNRMFGGMPANYTYMPPYTNIFSPIGKIMRLDLPFLHIGLVFLYLLGFYIFLLSLGCKPWLSLLGAVAYACLGSNYRTDFYRTEYTLEPPANQLLSDDHYIGCCYCLFSLCDPRTYAEKLF